jgi:cell division protein FtsA
MALKMKPKGALLAALDLGSSKIACFIGRVINDNDGIEVIGIGHQASKGIKSGTIIDAEAAEGAIRAAVHTAENMAADVIHGFPLRDVIVNLPGNHAASHLVQVDVQIAGHEVTGADVTRALAKAQEFALKDDKELVHTIPTRYAIDGHDGIRDPRGMYGQQLRVNTHLVTGTLTAMKNLSGCIDRSYLDIHSIALSSYAAGLSSIVDDEMDLGCTVIDMGGGVTSFTVFQGGALQYADAVPVGGAHVTSDIAKGLTTSITAAERIKTLYGSAMATSSDDHELIDVPPLGEEENQGSANHIPRSLLVGIIQPRLEETLEMVRAKMNDSGLGPLIGRRVVLTGGACQMPGLRELTQLILNKQVRVGRPIRVAGLAEAVSGPAFSTTAGLLIYACSRTQEMPQSILDDANTRPLMDRVKSWLKENW